MNKNVLGWNVLDDKIRGWIWSKMTSNKYSLARKVFNHQEKPCFQVVRHKQDMRKTDLSTCRALSSKCTEDINRDLNPETAWGKVESTSWSSTGEAFLKRTLLIREMRQTDKWEHMKLKGCNLRLMVGVMLTLDRSMAADRHGAEITSWSTSRNIDKALGLAGLLPSVAHHL